MTEAIFSLTKKAALEFTDRYLTQHSTYYIFRARWPCVLSCAHHSHSDIQALEPRGRQHGWGCLASCSHCCTASTLSLQLPTGHPGTPAAVKAHGHLCSPAILLVTDNPGNMNDCTRKEKVHRPCKCPSINIH